MITQDDIQGHWQRDWIRAPGFEDDQTRVHWMQAGHIYADIRVPAARPDLGHAKCLADLPAADLAQLLQAEGFAGTTSVIDGICTWRRAINWHGETEEIDAGHLSFKSPDVLIEDGVHAEYRELWTRKGSEPSEGLCLMGPSCVGYLVSVGTRFVFGLGAVDAASSDPLSAALSRGEIDAQTCAAQFERVHVFGHWRGDEGIAELATNPYLEGQTVLLRGEVIKWHGQSFEGAPVHHVLEAA